MKRFLLPALLLAALPLPLRPAAESPAAPAAPAANPSADDLWKQMEKLQQQPDTKPATREEALAQIKEWFAKQKAAAEDFAQKFPQDPRSWQARMIAIRADFQSRRFSGEKSDPVADKKKLDEIINAPDAPTSAKGEASFMAIVMNLGDLIRGEDPAAFAAFYRATADYLKKYPDHELAGELKTIEMQVLEKDPTATGLELLKKLAAGNDPRLADTAKELLAKKQKVADLKSKPIDLKFKAVDGQPIDLANLRGKVVLVDFWASWCGPCMGEMPNVVSTYGRLHAKGFEIVGISLDQQKDAMEAALKKQNMTWPQYFDGGGWNNQISRSFGIDSIPAAWLVDKKGMVRQTGLRGEELGAAIEKLLAE